jgi:hypothetical protein
VDGNTLLLLSTNKYNRHVKMNMTSVKESVKKTNKSPTPTRAVEPSSPVTSPLKNAPNNSAIDGKKALTPKPVTPVSTPALTAAERVSTIAAKVKDASTPGPQPFTPVSTPAPTAAKVSTIGAKANDARTPAPQSFALPTETTPAPAPKAVAVEVKKSPVQKSAVSAPRATTIEAKIDVGFGNRLYLRGQGPGLSWERGVPCECVNRNTWRWTAPTAAKLTFKLLLNDSVWARGADLVIGPGERVEVVPAF